MRRDGQINTPQMLVRAPADLAALRRFLKKVRFHDVSECWIWKGYRDRKGYGQFRYQGKVRWAHRVSYTLFFGAVPDDLTVHHTCRRSGCVNPCHLSVLTNGDNVADGNGHRHDEEIPI